MLDGELGRPGAGMDFQPTPFGPLVGFIVVVDVAQEEVTLGLVHDNADIGAYPHRPEMLVLGFVDAMELETRVGRIYLEIESGILDGLLRLNGEAGEAICKTIRDPEFRLSALFRFR